MPKKTNHFYGQFGFTLIEMLMVLSVIAIMAVLILAQYRSSQERYAFSQASQQMISDLRRAQNMAISGTDIYEQYYGYGFYLEKDDSFYLLYGDDNGNSTYQTSDTIIDTIYLPDKTIVNPISPLTSKIDVFFRPPDPTTFINGNDSVGLTGTIILELDGSSLTKTITVSTAGLIQID